MKIAIVTRHAVSNYGSFLQAYATQELLADLGHDPLIINYIRPDEYAGEVEKALLRKKAFWNSNIVSRVLYLTLRLPESNMAWKMFEAERGTHLRLTKRYSTMKELCDNLPEADLYMTGSDQVWGPVANGLLDDVYTLTFLPKEAPRVAFAASIGRSTIPTEQLPSFIGALQLYRDITVREDTAVTLLSGWGVESHQILDPTLLLEGDRWRLLEESTMDRDYVLVYQIHHDSPVERIARAVAKELGLPLVRVSTMAHQRFWGGRMRLLPSVGQFISYFDNASYVVTDSLHGTAFSINLSKPFVEVLPRNGTNSRNESLLRALGLQGRIVSDEDDVHKTFDPIDYETVQMALQEKRRQSIELLEGMVGDRG